MAGAAERSSISNVSTVSQTAFTVTSVGRGTINDVKVNKNLICLQRSFN